MRLAERFGLSAHARVRPRALVGERYRVVRRLSGKGASMGIVHEARDTVTRERVALKTTRQDRKEPDLALRLQLEGLALAMVDHPNVVALRARGDDEAVGPFVALELLEGETLNARIRREGPQSFDHLARIGAQVCDALEAVHRAGMVHRDLKPENVWLCTDGTVRLIDFGLALLPSGEAAWLPAGRVVGTPAMMAPEQWRDEELDGRADLFSLGATFYEAMTGKLAFEGGPSSNVIDQVLQHDPFERLLDLRPDVPLPWFMFLHRLLAKERGRRPRRARFVRRALEVLMETTEPIATVRVSSVLAGLEAPRRAAARRRVHTG